MSEKYCQRCGRFLQDGMLCDCYEKDLYAKVHYEMLYENSLVARKNEKIVFESSSVDQPAEHRKDDDAFK